MGRVRTTFNGNGEARLRFGNCGDIGRVAVSLDGREISFASPRQTRSISFEFNEGSSLTLWEEGQNSIIQIDDLEVISCKSTFLVE